MSLEADDDCPPTLSKYWEDDRGSSGKRTKSKNDSTMTNGFHQRLKNKETGIRDSFAVSAGRIEKFERRFECKDCPKRYFSQETRDAHVRQFHPSKSKVVLDDKSDVKKKGNNKLKGKASSGDKVNNDRQSSLSCQNCGQDFASEAQLHDHNTSNCKKSMLKGRGRSRGGKITGRPRGNNNGFPKSEMPCLKTRMKTRQNSAGSSSTTATSTSAPSVNEDDEDEEEDEEEPKQSPSTTKNDFHLFKYLYQCGECSRMFKSFPILDTHLKSVHVTRSS